VTTKTGNKINGLGLIAIAVLLFSGCASTGTVSSAGDSEQTISGDSGSTAEATAATAATAEGVVAATEDAGAKPKKPKLICTKERVTGSHRTTRVCRTAEQEAERRENDQKAIGDLLSTPGGGSQG